MRSTAPIDRSAIMRAIRGKNTKPELRIRQLLHRLGYRFRIHYRGAPGTPDIAFPSRRSVILIHGCFWHQHQDEACPYRGKRPRSNLAYWNPKLERIQARDALQSERLALEGWRAMTVWECQAGMPGLEEKLRRFLGPPRWRTASRIDASADDV